MAPTARERAYQKRRYEEWQARLAEKRDRRRRRRQIGYGVVLAALGVVAVVAGITTALQDGDDAAPAAAPGPAASASATPTTDASAAASNPCPTPTVKPPEKPKQFASAPAASLAEGKAWTVTLKTTCGDVVLSLDGAKAPTAVASTLTLVRGAFYDGSPCHRLTTTGIFVLQCGDPTGTGSGGPGYSYGPVENAPKNDVYPAGTVAMARVGGQGDSMGSQFFLVYRDSTIPSDAAGGYTVLGTITKGLDVVTKVAEGGVAGGAGDGAPQRPISIVSTTVTAG